MDGQIILSLTTGVISALIVIMAQWMVPEFKSKTTKFLCIVIASLVLLICVFALLLYFTDLS